MLRLCSFVLACWLAHSSRSVALPVDDAEPEAEPPTVVYETSDPHDAATGSIEEILKKQVQDSVAASTRDLAFSASGRTDDSGNSTAAADEKLQQLKKETELQKTRAAQERERIDEEHSRHSRDMMEMEDTLSKKLGELQGREQNLYAAQHRLESQLGKGEAEMINVHQQAEEGRFLHQRIQKNIFDGEQEKLKSKYKSRIHPHRFAHAKESGLRQ
ncbi:hypothetical protein NCLIV_060310 [Neospora caninum Liverpool]|uniref:Uncharacterized protein n=1 Tax=Neospora caninum (strain Liverpool) TaxID=572307 RepID=F0VPG0_NEOCL|nr:hypothetical protein NCLIV_060310 [Neospora caninum Liverpool]CBZ55606.1 hypothetical protein NCLIV_060310 [Neospora caninum Liverpool]CEL70349.1 TPA: hypothetical protein BN1204_060310 [Neospora caninum Liverpool]|eukprot:XP_003885634.1 hypothetical protein NCLIV_060310 [Neospora caninum Liverpool]